MDRMEYQVSEILPSGRKRVWPYFMPLKIAQDVCRRFTQIDSKPVYAVKKVIHACC
ncbi:MAG: hypothetical protein JRG97_15620 [Deltaproteobacteria bacterium]|nr:hypothetical protein [Deltaproteobacteria bacterium]MBW2142462.1 hypothetical protein [Deltaproteobacteria bacterium]